MTIHYAQCWEDPRTLCDALAITDDDDVISIASGGDNTLALLLANPRSITAVDYNPEQLHLLKLKLRALEQLNYKDFIGFIGAAPCRNRMSLYQQLRESLGAPEREYWDSRGDILNRGVIHYGKFERYFAYFRRWMLPLVQRPRSVRRLLALKSLEEQKEFYNRVWNNRRWRWLFRVFFGRFLLGRLGRSPEFFRYVKECNIAETLADRSRRGITEIPMADNFFIQYILTGAYPDPVEAHPYMRESNFRFLKENVHRIKLVQASLVEHLRTLPEGSISRFNLSDVFEYLSEVEVEKTLKEIVRVGRLEARLAFWTLFVPRKIPPSLTSHLVSETEPAQRLYVSDRAFFYGAFNIWRIGNVIP